MAVPTIEWIGCAPANFAAGRPGGHKPEAIVIHVMDGTFAGTRSWFNDPHAKVSAHYGISQQGQIQQYVRETDTAFHAGLVISPTWSLLKSRVNPNFYTIGIEHEGRGAGPAWPSAQLEASTELIADIAARWGIPIDPEHIVPHHCIRNDKSCPGSGVVLGQLVAMASSVPPGAAPTVLADGPGTLTVLAQANVRPLPSAQTKSRRVLPSGATLTPTTTVRGEAVNGNPVWYQLASDEYLWAGATDHPAG